MKVLDLDATSYRRPMLHADARVWVEKNCYVDIWIETIHAAGCEPMAMLPFVVSLDVEGDQWTFFKPKHDKRWELYGIDVKELNCWRPLLEHAQEHLGAGKLISVESDAWWLPDTSGTDYRRQHTKSTIVLNDLDASARRLGYFHNAGYFELEGDDFAGLFAAAGAGLPPYVEFVRLEGLHRLEPHELVTRAAALSRAHFDRRPANNPVRRFRTRFAADLPWLQGEPMSTFHLYAFATLRQCGAGAEVAATFLHWLGCHGHRGLEPAATAYQRVAASAKGMQFTLARAVTGRSVDFAPMFDAMERDWDQATAVLAARHGD